MYDVFFWPNNSRVKARGVHVVSISVFSCFWLPTQRVYVFLRIGQTKMACCVVRLLCKRIRRMGVLVLTAAVIVNLVSFVGERLVCGRAFDRCFS